MDDDKTIGDGNVGEQEQPVSISVNDCEDPQQGDGFDRPTALN